MMLRLRPLVVVTGTPHVEGGFTSERRARRRRKGVVTEELTITKDRKRANVIAVDHSRRLRKMAILRTPFGLLLDPSKLATVQELSRQLSRDAIAFNKTSSTTEITNCLLVEPLAGPRRAAVEGWIARRLSRGDAKALAARPALEMPAAPVAPPAAEPETPEPAEAPEPPAVE
jgi:hypothetical protein